MLHDAVPSMAAPTLRRASMAGFLGTFVEWFDYACYGYLASIFAVIFFPATDARSGLMAAYGVFALSFVVRPIGAMIWGHFGDAYGRKAALSSSILIMSIATAAIAILPTYGSAGFWAPALLLLARLAQGFAASGEYAGAASFLAEHAPKERRGLFTCLVPAGEAAGLLASSLFIALLHGWLTADQMLAWGWRVPFMLALPFGLVGLFVRSRLAESPQFNQLEATSATTQVPLKEIATKHRSSLAIGFGGTMLNAVGFYLVLGYMPIYLTSELGMSETDSFMGSSVALLAYLLAIFVMGAASDRFGRKQVLIVCSVLFGLLTVPVFIVLNRVASDAMGATDLAIIFASWSFFGLLLSMNGGVLPAFLCELFPTKVRFSGFAISFNSANALFGGTAPLISTWLIGLTGSKLAPAWYLVVAALVTLFAISRARTGNGPDPAAVPSYTIPVETRHE